MTVAPLRRPLQRSHHRLVVLRCAAPLAPRELLAEPVGGVLLRPRAALHVALRPRALAHAALDLAASHVLRPRADCWKDPAVVAQRLLRPLAGLHVALRPRARADAAVDLAAAGVLRTRADCWKDPAVAAQRLVGLCCCHADWARLRRRKARPHSQLATLTPAPPQGSFDVHVDDVSHQPLTLFLREVFHCRLACVTADNEEACVDVDTVAVDIRARAPHLHRARGALQQLLVLHNHGCVRLVEDNTAALGSNAASHVGLLLATGAVELERVLAVLQRHVGVAAVSRPSLWRGTARSCAAPWLARPGWSLLPRTSAAGACTPPGGA